MWSDVSAPLCGDSPLATRGEKGLLESRRPAESFASEARVRDDLRSGMLHGMPHGAAVLYEFWLPCGNTRADVVVLSGCMMAFEIKTRRDTLLRLPHQARAYGRVFDRCFAVVAERHVPGSLDILPEWWGIAVIAEDPAVPKFAPIRLGGRNVDIDPEILVRLLWRDEVRRILRALGHGDRATGSRSSMWNHLLSVVDASRLSALVREALSLRHAASADRIGRFPRGATTP